MTLYAVKPRFQALLRPITRRLAEAGATANGVTIAAAAGSVGLGALLAAAPDRPAAFLLLPAWLAIRMGLNAIDGMLAREHGQQSRLGACLNEVGDVVSDAALMLPLALVAPFPATAVVLVVVLALISELAGVLGQVIGAGRRYEGPLGKSDRAVVLGALGGWIGLSGLGVTPVLAPLVAQCIAGAMALLLVATIANRLRAALTVEPPQ